MEEIEIRDALRRHVSSAEPPMRLTATTLLSAGRRRHWWRLGTTIGSAGVATALAVVGALAVLPPGGSSPWADDGPCKVPLARDFSPRPSAYEPLDPSPPPPSPSPPPSPWPTTEVPTPYPTFEPSGYPASPPPTSYPSFGPSDHPASPTAYPTEEDMVVLPPPARFNRPTSTPSADAARMQAMECHLRNGLMALAPGATYAPVTGHGPMKVYATWGYAVGGQSVVLCANAIIVHPRETVQFGVSTEPTWQRPTGPEHGWSYREDRGAVLTHLRRDDGLLLVHVYLEHSMVIISVTGTLFTAEQLENLVNAPELDISG